MLGALHIEFCVVLFTQVMTKSGFELLYIRFGSGVSLPCLSAALDALDFSPLDRQRTSVKMPPESIHISQLSDLGSMQLRLESLVREPSAIVSSRVGITHISSLVDSLCFSLW